MPYTSTTTVSALDTPTNPALRERGMAPLGSSVWTSSGDLADRGITGIAHAASGAMDPSLGIGFDPTAESVAASIRNSFVLAAAHGHDSLAVPFVAGGIFYRRIVPPIDRDELAAIIVRACHEGRNGISAVLVGYDENDMTSFRRGLGDVHDDGIRLVQGSITDINDHGCSAIVNAANMEVRFGGGISGIIARATGEADEIDAEAAAAVRRFWEVSG